jgi:hypothetical protein
MTNSTEVATANLALDAAADLVRKCNARVADHIQAIADAKAAVAKAEARVAEANPDHDPGELLEATEAAFAALLTAEKRHNLAVQMAAGAVMRHRKARAATFADQYRDAIAQKISAAEKFERGLAMLQTAMEESMVANASISACWAAGIVKPSNVQLHQYPVHDLVTYRLLPSHEEAAQWGNVR